MNNITVYGRLTSDPSGNRFSVADNGKDCTNYFTVFMNKNNTSVLEHMKKGDRIIVTGMLRTDVYNGKPSDVILFPNVTLVETRGE